MSSYWAYSSAYQRPLRASSSALTFPSWAPLATLRCMWLPSRHRQHRCQLSDQRSASKAQVASPPILSISWITLWWPPSRLAFAVFPSQSQSLWFLLTRVCIIHSALLDNNRQAIWASRSASEEAILLSHLSGNLPWFTLSALQCLLEFIVGV